MTSEQTAKSEHTVRSASVSSETNQTDQAGGAEQDSEQGVDPPSPSVQDLESAKDSLPAADDAVAEEERNDAGCAAGSDVVSRCCDRRCREV